jgi:hypothetical protein
VRLALRVFVVVVGFLILAGAVNTAIVGSNGVLNRVAEHRVLPDWFRFPHRRYGTTHRLINLVVGLQILTIVASRGDVYTLGEAYAFGVVWSSVFEALSKDILPFKDRRPRAWRVPLASRSAAASRVPARSDAHLPRPLAIALVNLLTKTVATEWCRVHGGLLRGLLDLGARAIATAPRSLESSTFATPRARAAGPGRPAGCRSSGARSAQPAPPRSCAARGRARGRRRRGADDRRSAVSRGDGSNTNFTPDAQGIFTAVVDLAERLGKSVVPLVLSSNDAFFAIARTAQELGATEVVLGRSGKLSAALQAEMFALRWGPAETDTDRRNVVRVRSERAVLRYEL